MRSKDDAPWMPGTAAPDRVAPRECVRAAQEALSRSYGSGTAWEGLYGIRDCLDWLRRAMEQITDA